MSFENPVKDVVTNQKAEQQETENLPWVIDVKREDAEDEVLERNEQIETGEIESPKGSEYKIGPSKSGNENEVGIYLFDPTARKDKE